MTAAQRGDNPRAEQGHFERPIPCPGRLALCGVPCGCQGRNPSHRPKETR